MKFFTKYFLYSFCILLFFIFGNFVFAETDIYGGVISEDTIWNADGSPYVIYAPAEVIIGESTSTDENTGEIIITPIYAPMEPSFAVGAGATLTIEAGTIVKFDYGESVIVLGNLITNGTTDEKVYFTSINDDSVGGDTNLDDGIITPYNTDWTGIQVTGGGSIELNNSVVSYTDTALFFDSSTGQINNTDIINCQDGVIVNTSSLDINNSNIKDLNGDGIVAIFSSLLNIYNSNIENIPGDLLFLYSNSTSTIQSTTINNIGGYGIEVNNNSSMFFEDSSISNVSGRVFDVFDRSIANINNSNMENLGSVIEVFNDSQIEISSSSVKNSGKVLSIFNDSSIDVDNSIFDQVSSNYALELYNGSHLNFSNSILKNILGIAIEAHGDEWNDYGTTTLNISSSTISDGNNIGLQLFGSKLEVNISKTKIQNFAGDGIQTYSYPTVSLKDSEVSNNGDNGIQTYANSNFSIKNTNILNNINNGILIFSNSNVLIEDSKISNNDNGIESWGANMEIKNSIISDNTNFGITNNPVESGAPSILAINNWWGDKSGPFNVDTNASGTANQVTENVEFSPWLKFDPRIPRKTPVIIVPGLLGTELEYDTESLWLNLEKMFKDIGDTFLDSLMFSPDLIPLNNIKVTNIIGKKNVSIISYDYSDGLINDIKNNGYIEGTSSDATLFTFPYDWRYGVTGIMPDGSTTVELLKNKIQEILNQTGSDKVDIIAHSTGGLLVKKYVIDNQSDSHINKAIFVGVPNTGAPKAVKSLIQGDNANMPVLSSQEMKKLFINFPVTYDLLPSKQYFDVKGSYVEIINEKFFEDTVTKDLNFNEVNNYLLNDYSLNSTAMTNANNLHTKEFDNFDMRTTGIDLYNIVGCKTGTFGKVVEVRHTGYGGIKSVWYKKSAEVPGDNTVPLESSTNLPIDQSNKFYALKADHGKMMSQDGIKEKITNIISGSNLEVKDKLITQDISKCELNGKGISVYSPIDIDVIDQDGNHTGIDIDGNITNDIPNADIQIWDDHKFIYLPTDEGQIYTINMRGTGTGTYNIESDTITNGQYIKTDRFSNLPVTPELIGNIDISSSTTILLVKTNASSTVEIIKPDLPSIDKCSMCTGIVEFTPTRVDNIIVSNIIIDENSEVSTTAKKIGNSISTSTIINIKKNVVKNNIIVSKSKKIEDKVVKSIEKQVDAVIQPKPRFNIFDSIKKIFKIIFMFWKK